MTPEEFNDKVNHLRDSLSKIVNEYIESNKEYDNGDILRISFKKCGEKYIFNCKITNIYCAPDTVSLLNWPSPTIRYFARYCWKDENGNIRVGDHCPLGHLEGQMNICGHLGVEYDTVKIKVIKESEL